MMAATAATATMRRQHNFRFRCFDGSLALLLNAMIKILVILCFTAHLIVLQSNITQTMILFDSSDVPSSSSDLPTTRVSPERRNEENLGVNTFTSSNSSDFVTVPIILGRTLNLSAVFGDSYTGRRLPINALDLMTHHPTTIPLEELVHTDANPPCKRHRAGKYLFESSTDWNTSITHPPGRYIPKIIHLTAKSRCMPPIVHDHLQKWKNVPGHNVYLHDDAAVERLLFETYWPEFPHINLLRPCMISGAAMADLWRYLVLYKYGGIYADLDAAPGPLFVPKNGTSSVIISDSDQAWFVVERIGIPSQYFLASAPKHPLMHLLVTVTLRRLLEVPSVGEQYVPFVTGPGALKEAWQHFLNSKEEVAAAAEEEENGLAETEGNGEAVQSRRGRRLSEASNEMEAATPMKRPGLESVVYTGMLNWTVTIAGNRGNTRRIINREALKKKRNHWQSMGMRHFDRAKDASLNISCYERIYTYYSQPSGLAAGGTGD